MARRAPPAICDSVGSWGHPPVSPWLRPPSPRASERPSDLARVARARALPTARRRAGRRLHPLCRRMVCPAVLPSTRLPPPHDAVGGASPSVPVSRATAHARPRTRPSVRHDVARARSWPEWAPWLSLLPPPSTLWVAASTLRMAPPPWPCRPGPRSRPTAGPAAPHLPVPFMDAQPAAAVAAALRRDLDSDSEAARGLCGEPNKTGRPGAAAVLSGARLWGSPSPDGGGPVGSASATTTVAATAR